MFNLIDLIVILIILIAALLGYKRGFIKTSFRICSFAVAIILSLIFYKPLAGYIKENTNIYNWIANTIIAENSSQNEEVVDNDEIIQESQEELEESEVVANQKEETLVDETEEPTKEKAELTEFLENLPQNVKDYLGIDETIQETKGQLAIKVADVITNVISMTTIYIVVKLILMVVCFILDGIMQIPILKQINEVWGLILGTILGIIQVYTIFAVLTFLSSFIQMPGVIALIKSSLIAKTLFEYNLLITLIF